MPALQDTTESSENRSIKRDGLFLMNLSHCDDLHFKNIRILLSLLLLLSSGIV